MCGIQTWQRIFSNHAHGGGLECGATYYAVGAILLLAILLQGCIHGVVEQSEGGNFTSKQAGELSASEEEALGQLRLVLIDRQT